jgi:hypothetical protein
MEMSSHLHAPAVLPPVEDLQIRVGPRTGLDAVAKNEKPFTAPAGKWTPVVRPTIQTELLQLVRNIGEAKCSKMEEGMVNIWK